jgi:hypothetical protein
LGILLTLYYHSNIGHLDGILYKVNKDDEEMVRTRFSNKIYLKNGKSATILTFSIWRTDFSVTVNSCLATNIDFLGKARAATVSVPTIVSSESAISLTSRP